MGYLLAFFRGIVFMVVCLLTTLIILISKVFFLSEKVFFPVFRVSSAVCRFFLNIHVCSYGAAPHECGVLMSNHRSYIDIILIPSRVPYVIVAKEEVKSWPVVGWTARSLGVIFVNRQSLRSSRKMREDLVDRVSRGKSVLIYGEGTTFDGPGILPLKRGIFTAATEAGLNIIPVAIEFEDKYMAWVGDDTFLAHFFRCFRQWRTNVDVSVGPVMRNADADVLRQRAQDWIDSETRRLR